MPRFWKGKKVLVVGGAGFIGSHTIDALILCGAKVAAIDDFSTGRRAFLNPAARFYRGNAASVPLLRRVFDREKPEFVMMFAALVDVPVAIQQPVRAAESIVATVNVLQRSVEHGVKKVLYASSGYIYGNAPERPTSERSPFQALNPYSISKGACEHFLGFFSRHYGLPYVAMRYAPAYGPRRTIGPIADYIRHVLRGSSAEIYGRKTRDYIYISDIVRANLLAMERSIANVEPVFNIGTGREVGLEDVYRTIARLAGRSEARPVLKAAKGNEVERFVLDVKKARRVLGFRANVTLAEGLAKTIDWFRGTKGRQR